MGDLTISSSFQTSSEVKLPQRRIPKTRIKPYVARYPTQIPMKLLVTKQRSLTSLKADGDQDVFFPERSESVRLSSQVPKPPAPRYFSSLDGHEKPYRNYMNDAPSDAYMTVSHTNAKVNYTPDR